VVGYRNGEYVQYYFKTYSLISSLLQDTLNMVQQNSSVSLPTGQKMPILGFGTWNVSS